jgi:hypothetical protein
MDCSPAKSQEVELLSDLQDAVCSPRAVTGRKKFVSERHVDVGGVCIVEHVEAFEGKLTA